MAGYRLYGGQAADQFSGESPAGATAEVWTTAVGGVRLLDLLDVSGAPTDRVTADDAGLFRFSARDQLGSLWLDPGLASGTRFVVHPSDIGDRLLALENLYNVAVVVQGQTDAFSAWSVRANDAIRGTQVLGDQATRALDGLAAQVQSLRDGIAAGVASQQALLSRLDDAFASLQQAVDQQASPTDPSPDQPTS